MEGDPETVRTHAEVIKGASEKVTSEKLEQKIRHHLLYHGYRTVNYLEVYLRTHKNLLTTFGPLLSGWKEWLNKWCYVMIII